MRQIFSPNNSLITPDDVQPGGQLWQIRCRPAELHSTRGGWGVEAGGGPWQSGQSVEPGTRSQFNTQHFRETLSNPSKHSLCSWYHDPSCLLCEWEYLWSGVLDCTAGWKVVNITLENMTHYLPRMGYLFSDGLFDLAKVNQRMEQLLIGLPCSGGNRRTENHSERKCWIILTKGGLSQEKVQRVQVLSASHRDWVAGGGRVHRRDSLRVHAGWPGAPCWIQGWSDQWKKENRGKVIRLLNQE